MGRLIASEQGGMQTEYTYDQFNRQIKSYYYDAILEDGYETYSYDSDTENSISDGTLTSMRMYSGDTIAYQYNNLQQLAYKHIASNRSGGGFWEGYTYNGTQVLIKRNWISDTALTHTFTYTYDGNGNIMTETLNGSTKTYAYDNLNQLTGVTGSRTESYTYDGYGNLLTFHNGVQTLSFGYGNDQWKDQLTTVTKGNTTKTITYDAVGNPTSFYDGFLYSMEWSEGRNLTKLHYHYDANDPSVARTTTYQYNADGLRTKKINPNGTYTVYHIADGRYVGETQFGTDNKPDLFIRYVYDESGSVVGIGLWESGDIAWTDFYFLKNLQGDVIEVYRESDNALVASYSYDSWGYVTASGDATFAGKAIKDLNPFRYRGYYYDNETWFYYLQSRYYDPAIGRFINADKVTAGAGASMQSYNTYAYCLNNPVNLSDPAGTWPSWSDITSGFRKAVDWVNDNIVEPTVNFVEDIAEDLSNFDSNNQSESKVFESNYISGYKGALVIKTPFEKSFSFGIIGLSTQQQNADTLNHEYGHILQLRNKGLTGFVFDVAIPSITISILDDQEKLPYDYYTYPFEAEANELGGSNLSQSRKAPLPKGGYTSYWDLIPLFF